MKDAKRKTIIKAARKAAKKDILEKLIPEIQKVSATAGLLSPKLEKLIAKEAKNLAKKIAGKILLDEAAIVPKAVAQKVVKVAKAEAPIVTKVDKTTAKKEAKKPAKVEVVTAS